MRLMISLPWSRLENRWNTTHLQTQSQPQALNFDSQPQTKTSDPVPSRPPGLLHEAIPEFIVGGEYEHAAWLRFLRGLNMIQWGLGFEGVAG